MVKLVRINVSIVPKIKKIFSTLTPSSGQTISSIGLSNISLESVLHKLSFGIKISRLPVDPKPYGKKTDFLLFSSNTWIKVTVCTFSLYTIIVSAILTYVSVLYKIYYNYL
jgi:hypothetical protein